MENEKLIELLEKINKKIDEENKEKQLIKQEEEKLKKQEEKEQKELIEQKNKEEEEELKEKEQKEIYEKDLLDTLKEIKTQTTSSDVTIADNTQLTNIENYLVSLNYIGTIILILLGISLFAKGWLSNGD